MLAALGRISQGIDLDIAHVRLVLNVMRSDPRVQIKYTPAARSNVLPFRRGLEGMDEYESHYNKSKRKKKEPKLIVPVKGKINYDFGISMNRRSELIHGVSQTKSIFEFRRAGSRDYFVGDHAKARKMYGWEVVDHDRIHVELRWDCSLKAPYNCRLFNLAEGMRLIEEGLYRVCPRCVEVKGA